MLTDRKDIKAEISIYLVLVALISFLPVFVFSQDSISKENHLELVGQLRSRFEARNGTFRPLEKNENPAVLLTQRVRFTMDYSNKDLISIRIAPQSVSIWGNSPLTQTTEKKNSAIVLYEAWASIKLSTAIKLKIGRQPISLDDERFFGELDWAQGGRVHDAVLLQFKIKKSELKSFTAFNQNYTTLYNDNINNPSGNLFNTTNSVPYKWMQTIWAGLPSGTSGKFSFLFSGIGLQHSVEPDFNNKTNFLITGGANYFYNGKNQSGTASFYYQTGKNINGIKTTAFLFAVHTGIKLDPNWRILLGSDFLSGNNIGKATSDNRAFNPIFNTGHKFYGYMDYYYAGNGHKNTGLSDNYLSFQYKGKKTFSMTMVLHQFITPSHIQTNEKKYSNNLGQELDLTFQKVINKYAILDGGFSLYRTTPTINFLKTVENSRLIQHWIWLSLIVKPTLFKTTF